MATLTQIHAVPNNSALHVVFVHGLGGHERTTWMHNPKDHTTLWPAWIGEDVKCNVWIARYGAALSGWTDTSMHLADLGESLFTALQVEPALRGQRIVLVGHSLGGLLIKSGMTQAETLGDSRLTPTLSSVVGVVFIGTPHQGSSLATLASNLSLLLRTNPQVVNMTNDDAWLKQLNGQFRNLQTKRKFAIRVFFETNGILLGRKLWRLNFGKHVIIVDRNSSDPGIAGVIPTALDGNHIEIAKPKTRQALAHKSLVEFLTEVNRAPIIPTASSSERWPSVDQIAARIHIASAALLTWPSTLPDGTWLPRPELNSLDTALNDADSMTHFLLGEPGSGKSSLLVRLAQQKAASGWIVLAIKADRLPPETRTRDALNQYLNLGPDVVDLLRHLAQSSSILVVIDQVDALAELVVQQSARLRVLLDLVKDLADTSNIHTIISCRTFEQKHDPSLRNIDASIVSLELPSWASVSAVLESRGLQANSWNDDMKEVLRSPHALDVYLSLLDGPTEPAALKSFHGMLEEQWTTHVLSDKTGSRKATIQHITKLMAEREVLGLPSAILDDHFDAIKALSAAGLLRLDSGPGRVEFRHQTLYEFVRARTFLEESGSLTGAVKAQQNSLRIRPQLWHALGYFRNASPEDYSLEIDQLWNASLRPHLRMLLIEFLGRQTSPLAAEARLVELSISDSWFLPRFLGAAVGSPGWLSFLAPSHLPRLMSSHDNRAQIVIPLLRQALFFAAETVTELVRQHWLPSSIHDALSWQVLGGSDAVPQPGAWQNSLYLIAERTPIAEWAITHVASVISAARPDDAPELIKAWLNNQLNAAKTEGSSDSTANTPQDIGRRIQQILETQQLYDLEAIAEAAPKAFVTSVWPVFVEALELSTADAPPSVHRYRQSSGLGFQELEDASERNERPLLQALRLAIQRWAQHDANSFLDFADAHSDSTLVVVHRLLAVGRILTVGDYPDRAFSYLMSDSRRLVLGSYSDVHKESVTLIGAVCPLLNNEDFNKLEIMLRDWNYYNEDMQSKGDAKARQQRMIRARHHRLRLLRALPINRCSADIRRVIEEEERAFPGVPNHDAHFSGAHWIGSPVSAEQMRKAADAEILNLFKELPDDSAWDHPRHRMKGGAIQAGRELGNLAKIDVVKTLRIIRALEPGHNEIPVATVLRELIPAGMAASAFYELLIELEDKGFASPDFRRDAAYAVVSNVSKESPVPDVLIDRMEKWLVPYANDSSESSSTGSKDDNPSMLWAEGTLSALPGGNYPTLSAIIASCLSWGSSHSDRWMNILDAHIEKSESTRVWEALLERELLRLKESNLSRAEAFIEKLIQRAPTILATRGWVHFIAHANHWASSDSVERWTIVTLENGQNEQGAAEVICLRHALFPAEKWPRELIFRKAESRSIAFNIGIAHSVAHLWLEPMSRPVVHPVLLQLIKSTDEQALKALSAIFQEHGFSADSETKDLLDALSNNPGILRNGGAEDLPEILSKLVNVDPQRVFSLSNVLLDIAGEQMGNMATSWYLRTDWLLDIALHLQDMGKAEREAGATLFERMLEFNIPQARELSLNLDKRTPASQSPFAPRRRRVRTRRR
jgi:pimeloyl-ACP methyl ester carboxylesterase